jgi:5-methylthioadenosine/S-adenosylhomocysteine deaminase
MLTRRGFLGLSASATAGMAMSGWAAPRRQRVEPPRFGRVLVRGGWVLTMDQSLGDFRHADVLIDGSRIVAVGPNIEAEGAVIDASGMIVMPGFVDTHRHMWQGALRNSLSNGTIEEYLRHIHGARIHFHPEDVYAGNLVSALGALDSGVTTIMDWSHIGNTPAHTDAAIEALRQAGIRAVYGFGGGAPNPDRRFPEDIHRLRSEHFSREEDLLSLTLATGLNPSQWALAREVGARISVHVNTTGDLLPMEEHLGPDVTCIHCARLLDEEWELLAETGTRVSISAPVEMQMGHGVPPIQQALRHGIRPSLSVDVETTVAGDFFGQIRSIFSLQRMLAHQEGRDEGVNDPRVLTAKEVVEMATIQGAIDNGLERSTGSLSPGKEADVILLYPGRINVAPINNAYGVIVQGMDTSNVDTVIVRGEVRKWQGELVDVAVNRAIERATVSRDRILADAGWTKTDAGWEPGEGE